MRITERLSLTLLTAAVISLAISAYSRNDAWRSVLDLSLDITHKSPRKARVWNDLGNAFDDLDRFDDALPAYRKAIELDPFFQRAHYNLGLAFFGNHRFREAEQEFRIALALDPLDHEAMEYLSAIGRIEQRREIRLRENRME